MTTYDLTGPSGAPTIILLHAASHTRKMWLPVVPLLADDYRLLVPDLPGHGTLAQQPFDFGAAAAQVTTVMDQENVTNALLVGVSLGGWVAMDLTAYDPERISGLVISGSSFDPQGFLCRLVLTGESLAFPRGAKRFIGNFEQFLRDKYPASVAEEIIAGGFYWDAAADVVRALRGRDFRSRLQTYPGPTLILNGEQDWAHRTAEQAFLQAAQNGQVQTISEAGHTANLDQPEAFAAAVRAFAKTIYHTTSKEVHYA